MEKKYLYSIMLLAILGLAIVFTSCEKEEEVEAEPLPTATIQGTVRATLDVNEGMEDAPNGTKLLFSVYAGDLVSMPIEGYAYKTLQYEATVNGGKYTVPVPSSFEGDVEVTVTPVSFYANQKQTDNALEEKSYQSNPRTVVTRANAVYIENFDYN